MHQHVTPQELADHFTLLPAEHALVVNRSGPNRLGFAILLKYFQWEGRFPMSPQEIPSAVVAHLAETLGVAMHRFTRYDLEGRMARYHKEQIRQWTGFRSDTTRDAEAIIAWVCAHTRVEDATLPQVLARLGERYKALKIELPTPQRLERLAHSAVRTLEEQFLTTLAQALSPETCGLMDAMLTETASPLSLADLKADPGRPNLDSLEAEVAKLHQLQHLMLPQALLAPLSTRYLRRLKLRVAAESLHELRRHPAPIRYALVAVFCYVRCQEITDTLTDLLLQIVHKMGGNAEKRVDQALLTDLKRVKGKTGILFQMAEASLAQPKGQVQEVIYPVVGEQTLRDLVTEARASGVSYRDQVHTRMRGSYSHHYRRMVPPLLSALAFQSNNAQHQPVIEALDLMRQYASSKQRFYGMEEAVPLAGVVPREGRPRVIEQDAKGQTRVNRINRVVPQ